MRRTVWNKRLLASTRGKILTLLRTEKLTVNDLASALRLTDNAVRSHLSSLERDGLVQRRGRRRGRRRPHVTYGLSAEADHIFPKAYGPLLDQLVSVLGKRLPSRTLKSVMRQVGRDLAERHLPEFSRRTRRERVKIALDLLKDLGGAAGFHEIDGKPMIHGKNGCPLAAVTANHPEACLVVESMLSAVIGTRVTTCCHYRGTPRCCFEIGR